MTNLQILLDYLEPDVEIKDYAILNYFDSQDGKEFKIGDIDYLVLNFTEVRDLLREQCQEDIDEFKKTNNRNFPEIIKAIDFDDVVWELVENLSANDVISFDFLAEYNNAYIFT